MLDANLFSPVSVQHQSDSGNVRCECDRGCNRTLRMLYMYYLPLFLILCFLPSNVAAANSSSVIVIGFVGGFVHHNDSIHQEVQLANHLSKDYPSRMKVRIFENHSGRQAYQEITRLLDTDHDGNLSAGEKRKARIVLYGHSWGASEAVTLARTLQKESVDV